MLCTYGTHITLLILFPNVKYCVECNNRARIALSLLGFLDNLGYPYIWPSHCKDSQITSLKLYLIVTLIVNFKHNFHKENETFSRKKLKRFKEKSLKMEPFLSELPYHIYEWLIISLKDFCIVIRKWPTFLPSIGFP